MQTFGAWKSVVGQRHAPAALSSEKNLVPIVQEAAWAGPPDYAPH